MAQHMKQQRGFFSRIFGLWRGFWGTRLSDAEAENAELVYHNAIAERRREYGKLKDSVAQLVYHRNRVETGLRSKQEDLEVVSEALTESVFEAEKLAQANTEHESTDARALALLKRQRLLHTEVEGLQQDHNRLSQQAEEAKKSLVELAKAITRLQDESREMLVRRQHALTRMQIDTALQKSTHYDPARADQALENVRQAIFELEHRVDIDSETLGCNSDTPDAEADISPAKLRREAEERQDKRQLGELKLRLRSRLLPEGDAFESIDAMGGAQVVEVAS